MAEFTHLHSHTEYPLLDEACDLSKLMDRVAALGQKSVAMTGHGRVVQVWQTIQYGWPTSRFG
jgi:DNA polymerase-3 subunit alpha